MKKREAKMVFKLVTDMLTWHKQEHQLLIEVCRQAQLPMSDYYWDKARETYLEICEML